MSLLHDRRLGSQDVEGFGQLAELLRCHPGVILLRSGLLGGDLSLGRLFSGCSGFGGLLGLLLGGDFGFSGFLLLLLESVPVQLNR